MTQKHLVVKGVTVIPTTSYPGSVYGMYNWDCNENRWVINKSFCERHNIIILKK